MLHFWPVCSKYAAACSSRGFFGVFSVIVAFFWYRCSKSWICIHSVQFLMKKTHTQYFGLYAANMLQNAAALIFWGVFKNDCLFLSWIIWNDNFQSILNNFQWKNQYAAFFTCMQQVCCSMQQPRLFSDEHPF